MVGSRSTSELKEVKRRLSQLETSIESLATGLEESKKTWDSPFLKWGMFLFAGIGCILGVYNYHEDAKNASTAENHRRVDSDKLLDEAWSLLSQSGDESRIPAGIVSYNTNEERLHEAQRLIKYAIRIDAENPRGYDKLGCYYRALGQFRKTPAFSDDAISAFRRAIAIDPEYAQAYNNLGNALKEEDGDLEEAIANYREAVRLDPEHPIPTYSLAVALQENNELDEAIEYFKKTIELDGTNAAAHRRLVSALEAKGMTQEAEEARRRFDAIQK